MTAPECPAAFIRVRDHHGVFVADECEIEAGVVNAAGRWRYRYGTEARPDFRWSEPTRYTWPVDQLREVKWAT